MTRYVPRPTRALASLAVAFFAWIGSPLHANATHRTAWLLALVTVGCGTDQSRTVDVDKTLSPTISGTAIVPYSVATSVAMVGADAACTLDTYDVKVVCVDRTGGVVANFGREGEGPGEFLRPTSLVRGIDGNVGLVDGARNRFMVFTVGGDVVHETALPVSLFQPISPFGETVTGTYLASFVPTAAFVRSIVATEVALATGEVVAEWRPRRIPVMNECGAPNFGFPVLGDGNEDEWVFVGCNGHLAFIDESGDWKVFQAPTYVEELPNERDVRALRDDLDAFAEQVRGLGNSRFSPEDDLDGYADEPKHYYLARGHEILDEKGRLWMATSRDRDRFSYLDVYREAQHYGTVEVRDRLIAFDVLDNTLVVLVERQVGPLDPDGVPDRAIDWYDISEF